MYTGEDMEKSESSYTVRLGECKLIQPLWRTVWKFLKKLKIELPYNLAISLLGIYPEKTITEKDTYILMFTEALFTIARAWKQSRCASTDKWIKQLWYIYTMEYYSAIERNEFETVLFLINHKTGIQKCVNISSFFIV